MREQGDFTTAQSDFNAARGDSESPTRAVLGAELARRGRVLSERGKVGKGAERKVKNHFIDHSYHFIPNALASMYCAPHSAILLGTDLAADFYMILIRCDNSRVCEQMTAGALAGAR